MIKLETDLLDIQPAGLFTSANGRNRTRQEQDRNVATTNVRLFSEYS